MIICFCTLRKNVKRFLTKPRALEFQIKRHQAILKLSRTKENITQAEMLLTEVEPRLRHFVASSEKVGTQTRSGIELRETQEQYYFTLFFSHNHEQLSVLNTELIKIEEEYNEAHSHLQTLQSELAALAKEGSRQEQFAVLQRISDLSRQKINWNASARFCRKTADRIFQSRQAEYRWLENKLKI